MSQSLSLPPSQRDFQVYQRVVVEAVSTRQAAGEFSLSQTRIRQLIQRVIQWLTENLPPQSDTTDAAYLRHAQHVAADRLTFFYSEAMDGWRAERQMKYFSMAIRVAMAQSKLPVIPGTLECLAADAIEGPLPEDVGWAPPTEAPASARETQVGTAHPTPLTLDFTPPPRDCSLAECYT